MKAMFNIDFLGARYSEYRAIHNESEIRFRWVTYLEPGYGQVSDFCFEVFKKPWLFGRFRKKRWKQVVITHFYDIGLEYAKKELYGKEKK